jgi:hypothetical protein
MARYAQGDPDPDRLAAEKQPTASV